MEYLITTHPGFEDIGIEDLIRFGAAKNKIFLPKDVFGKVFVKTSSKVIKKLARVKSITGIYEVLGKRRFDGANSIYELLRMHRSKFKKQSIWILFKPVRKVLPDFDKLRRNLSRRLRLKLSRKPTYLLRVDTFRGSCVLSRFLFKPTWKDYRKVKLPFSMKPDLAHCIVRAAKFKKTETRIWDPFCGGGSIPIEMALLYKGKEIFGSDIDKEKIDASKINAKSAGVENKINFFVCDARNLVKASLDEVDCLIGELPYQLKAKTLEKLYTGFFSSAKKVLKQKGRIIVIVNRKRTVGKIADKLNFELLEKRRMIKGGYYTDFLQLVC
ncbi:hypothetical protein DRJ16_02115 [Candidatus Woesearchaeota archaeon]|nr:MAG: hypothetical protein DRJ16_02115 [Candidatus Woesearchaeota archaeon]